MVRVLFVCLGNICRSPTAEGVFRQLVKAQNLQDKIAWDSCGTSAYHIGHPADSRSQIFAKKRGIDISDLRARQVDDEDFFKYDYILAMDESNLYDLKDLCPPSEIDKLHMFLSFAKNTKLRSVPDPYYSGHDGFEKVLDLCQDAAAALLEHIKTKDLKINV